MAQEQMDDERWARFAAALKRPEERDERFVARVMAAVAAEADPEPADSPWALRWLVPAFAAAAAAVLLALAAPSAPLSAEGVLLASDVSASDEPSPEDLLDAALGAE